MEDFVNNSVLSLYPKNELNPAIFLSIQTILLRKRFDRLASLIETRRRGNKRLLIA